MGSHCGGFGVVTMTTLYVLLLSTSVMVLADSNNDKEECAQQLVGLATCLPYVGGDAKSPTPDCCSGLKQVLKANKKCLCVIIKDRDDPDLGLNINVTLALTLPSVCHAPANVSQCPALLKLPPNSPDAQVFYQFANNSSNATASSLAPGPTGGGKSEGTSSSSKGETGSAQQKSRGWFGLDSSTCLWVLLCHLILLLVPIH